MIDKWIGLFYDPLIGKAVITAGFLLLVLVTFLLFRRIIIKLDKEQKRNPLIDQALKYSGYAAAVILVIWIWAYQYMEEIFNEETLKNITGSGIGLVFFALAAFLLSRLISFQNISSEKKKQYIKWVIYALGSLYAFILLRIWAFTEQFELFRDPVMQKMYKSAFTVAIIYLVLVFVRRFINSLKIEIKKKHQYRKSAGYFATALYIIMLIPIWAGSPEQWTTFISVTGAGIALALNRVLLNFAGWIYIVIRRPFSAGDRIELDAVQGDVIDIRLLHTTLLEIGNWVQADQSTGRVVQVPHGELFFKPLYNYTKGFKYLWNEISVLVTFESNWEKARDIFLKCGEEESEEIQSQVKRQISQMAKEYLIYYRTFTPIVYTSIEDSGVKLTLRFLTEAKRRRGSHDQISRKMLKAFNAEPDIDFAYPTIRRYKPGEEKDNHRRPEGI